MKIKQTLKNILTLFCASIIIFSAAGCGNSTESGSSNSSNNASISNSGDNASDSSWTWSLEGCTGLIVTYHVFESNDEFSKFYSAFRTTNYAPVLSVSANGHENAKVGYYVEPHSAMGTGNIDDVDWFNFPYDLKLMTAVIRSCVIVNYGGEGLDSKRNSFKVALNYYYDYTRQKINLNELSFVECYVVTPEKCVWYDVLCGDLKIATLDVSVSEADSILLEQAKEWAIQNLVVLN